MSQDIHNYTYNNKYDNSVITSEKFDSATWNLIEKVPDNDEIKRLNVLKELGNNTSNNIYVDESKLSTIGEKFYLELRKELKSNLTFSDLNDKKVNKNNTNKEEVKDEDKTKKVNKKEKTEPLNKGKKFIEENVKKTIMGKLNELIILMNDKPKEKIYSDIINNNMNDSIEFRILLLMKIIETSSTRVIDAQDTQFKEELLIASKKILFFLRNILLKESSDLSYHYFKRVLKNDDIRLSKQLVLDFENKINILESVCSYKLYDIANRRPKLIYDTKYNETIPDITIKPYDSQIELMERLKII